MNSPGGFAAGAGALIGGAGAGGSAFGWFTSLNANILVNSPGSFAEGSAAGGGAAGGGGSGAIGDAGEKAVARIVLLWASSAARASAMLKTLVNSPGSFAGGAEAAGGGGAAGGIGGCAAGLGTTGGAPMEAAENAIVAASGDVGLGIVGEIGGAAPFCIALSTQAARLSNSGRGQLTTNGTPSCSAESMNRLRSGSGR